MNGGTCLWVQVSVRGHSTRTSLSSVVNTTVTGALKSQSQESAGTLSASLHCWWTQGQFQRATCSTILTFPRGLYLNYSLNVQARDHSLMLFYCLPLVGSQSTPTRMGEAGEDLPPCWLYKVTWKHLLNPVLSSNPPPPSRCTESEVKNNTERKCKNPPGLL